MEEEDGLGFFERFGVLRFWLGLGFGGVWMCGNRGMWNLGLGFGGFGFGLWM